MSDLKSLIAPLEDGDRYVFRLNHSRVYYVKLSIANLATSIARDQLLSLGTCLGKLTKTGKFRLHITALPIMAAGARHKIWVKENGAQPFLYGSNVVKAHVGRWSEDCPEHQGCVVYSMSDIPLGFGVVSLYLLYFVLGQDGKTRERETKMLMNDEKDGEEYDRGQEAGSHRCSLL